MITVRITTDQAMKKRLGTVARIFSPRSPTSLAASGSRNSGFGRWLSAARHPATMKAVSETFWMVWVMGRTEDERAAKCRYPQPSLLLWLSTRATGGTLDQF